MGYHVWHNIQTSGQRSQESPERKFRRILKSLPRPNPDPQLEWHLELYQQLTSLKRRLEKRTKTPLLSNEDLKVLKVVRGAERNIDEALPIDLEPRFFTAGPSRLVEEFTRWFKERGEVWPEPWSQSEFDIRNGKRLPDLRSISPFCTVFNDMMEWDEYIQDRGCRYHSSNPYWSSHGGTSFYYNPTRIISYKHDRITRGEYHQFGIEDLFYHKGEAHTHPNPSISHSIASITDTIVPDERILRSELLLAAMLLRHNLGTRHWPRHYTLPMLVLSFHEGGGRLLQVHTENRRLHVRVSRRLNLLSEGGNIPADGRLMAQWLLATPIGNTCFSGAPSRVTIRREDCDQHQPQDPGVASMLRIHTPAEPGIAATDDGREVF